MPPHMYSSHVYTVFTRLNYVQIPEIPEYRPPPESELRRTAGYNLGCGQPGLVGTNVNLRSYPRIQDSKKAIVASRSDTLNNRICKF